MRLAAAHFGAISAAMTILDPSRLIAAYRFVLANPRLVGLGAASYAVAFTLQSVITAYAAAGAEWAVPLALVFVIVAFTAFVGVLSYWGPHAIGETDAPARPDWALAVFGGPERRLLWVAFLVLILVFTVIGTAFLAVAFMLAGLALINVDASQEPPEGFVNIFALFGPGEATVAIVIGAVFVLFSLWFFLRLALAYPATVDQQRVQVLTAWPLSGRRRAVEMIVTLVLAAAPGIAALVVFNLASDALIGAWPGAAQSAAESTSGEGGLTVQPVLFAVSAFLYGFAKMALVAAPCVAALCALYVKYRTQSDISARSPET